MVVLEKQSLAVPFDLKALKVTGGPVPVVEAVWRASDLYTPQYAVSDSGTLGYMPATTAGAAAQRTLVWVDRNGHEEPLAASLNGYHDPRVSPDGTQVAYTSYESGRDEIYVRPFPNVNAGRWQISRNGGDSPLWSRDGREILYRNGNAVMAVLVKTSPAFIFETPRTLFQGTYVSRTNNPGSWDLETWDISPDGKRFLMMKESSAGGAGGGPRKINIVFNWLEELKQRVPVK